VQDVGHPRLSVSPRVGRGIGPIGSSPNRRCRLKPSRPPSIVSLRNRRRAADTSRRLRPVLQDGRAGPHQWVQ
jgi:hypothetical protein